MSAESINSRSRASLHEIPAQPAFKSILSRRKVSSAVEGCFAWLGCKLTNLIFSDQSMAVYALKTRSDIDRITGTTARSNACAFVAAYARDYLIHYFNKSNDSQGFDPNRSKFGKHYVNRVAGKMFAKQPERLKKSLDVLILRAMMNFSKNLKENESDPDLWAKVVQEAIEVLAQHYCLFNSFILGKEHKLESRHHLHPGVPPDNSNQEEAYQWRLRNFFYALSSKLMCLAFPEDELGVPGKYNPLFETRLWNALEKGQVAEQLLPALFNTLLTPAILDEILLFILKDSSEPGQDTHYQPPNDKLQQDLEKSCEALTKEIANLFPGLLKFLLNYVPYLSTLIASRLASSLRRTLHQSSLSTTIDQGIREILPKWKTGHPDWRIARWDKDEEGRDVLVPQKALKSTAINTHNEYLNFIFPETKVQEQTMIASIQAENDKLREELEKKVYIILREILLNFIPNTISFYWNKMHAKIDAFIEKYLGEHSVNTKNFIGSCLHTILITWIVRLLWTLALIPLWPISEALSYYLKTLCRRIVKIWHTPVQENAAYRLTEVFVKNLLERPSPPSATAPDLF